MTVHIGVTGSRYGWTLFQQATVASFLTDWNKGEERVLHHGGCSGVDYQCGKVARFMGYTVEVHPPTNDKYRAYGHEDIVHDPKPYLERNADLVKAVEFLLVLPRRPESVDPRSGTWATYRIARQLGVPCQLILP